jgi:homoserine dehydrogenase
MRAIAARKHVVTAHKEVIARHGHVIFPAARAAGVAVQVEATVAGGIPIVAAIKSSLAANRVRQVAGIINGTTNYILTAMAAHGQSLADALAEAQRELGLPVTAAQVEAIRRNLDSIDFQPE